jgi:hypothetical protein
MERVADAPDFNAVAPLPEETLLRLFGTEQPTHEAIEESEDFYSVLERGQGVYVLVYEGSRPSEILFAGYSFD